jgi:hypothetical protein
LVLAKIGRQKKAWRVIVPDKNGKTINQTKPQFLVQLKLRRYRIDQKIIRHIARIRTQIFPHFRF